MKKIQRIKKIYISNSVILNKLYSTIFSDNHRLDKIANGT